MAQQIEKQLEVMAIVHGWMQPANESAQRPCMETSRKCRKYSGTEIKRSRITENT